MNPNTDPTLHAYFSELGKRGKAAQTKNSTPEQRRELAKRAANARWHKNEKGNMTTEEQIHEADKAASRIKAELDSTEPDTPAHRSLQAEYEDALGKIADLNDEKAKGQTE